MGHTISYEGKTPTIKPTRDKCDAIRRVEKLSTVKDVQVFCGMVNYLSMYLKGLQELLVPLYALLKKGAKWNWTNECQKTLDTIKKMLIKPPVLVMPNLTGKFTLVSDTSKLATGAALYQEQQGVLRLVAYNSKQLPEAAMRYSISELELLGLTINIASFKHYLKGENFSVVIDHSALVYIINSEKEPPTLRLKKLLEILSQYSFNIRYLKGKEMYISDFLSRHPFIMQTWSDYGEKRDQVCDSRDIECEEIEPRDEHFAKNEGCTEIKSINTEVCKVTKIESQNTLEECNITTRGMR